MNLKQKILITTIGIDFCGILVCVNAQVFPGSDTFDAASKNITLWGTAGSVGAATLVQTNGHLCDTSTGLSTAGSDDTAVWPWNGVAPVNQDWAVQVDVNVPLTFTPLGTYAGYGQGYGMGIIASKTSLPAPSTYFSSGMLSDYTNATTTLHQFSSQYVYAAAGTDNIQRAPSGSVLASVRVRWVAATQTLYAEYDPDGPANGFSWTQLRTTTKPWPMTATDTFTILVFGDSYGLQITPNHQLFVQNFVATIGTNANVAVNLGFATELLWNSPLSREQQLQSSVDLKTWLNVGLPTIGNGQTNTFFDPSPQVPKKFYRVLVQ